MSIIILSTLKIQPHSVSDHSLLCLTGQENHVFRKALFKFFNCVVDLNGYDMAIMKSWNDPIVGKPMHVLWQKLKRLQPILKNLSKPILKIQQNISKSRSDILTTQYALTNDRMNIRKIEDVKKCTEEVINWNELEEKVLRQKSKIDWLKLGDGNNSYFHASIKAKHNAKNLNMLYKFGNKSCHLPN